ncbi:hypothetical protein GA0061105_101525 [Rhizobium aethiopicum]|uniref:Uncharacterized protein n=1 Tax=Rhizobium aethiopicum TaxID=1138170 RepID=A0A1C3XWQ3_9HYPH|nr:hypothetical protein GA0061105_101525 [Rhizobium aethiopicum]
MPFRHAALPERPISMLIVLVALSVVLSLAAEMAYGYFVDRYEVNWVRPELAEHAAIVRAQGRLRGNEGTGLRI